jgi:hypothetical protein
MEKIAAEQRLVKMASEAEMDGESLVFLDDSGAYLVESSGHIYEMDMEKTAALPVRQVFQAGGRGLKRFGAGVASGVKRIGSGIAAGGRSLGVGARRVGGEVRHAAMRAAPAVSGAAAAANRMSHFGPTHAAATGAAHLATDAGKALKRLRPKSRAGRVLQGAVAPASELAGVVLH